MFVIVKTTIIKIKFDKNKRNEEEKNIRQKKKKFFLSNGNKKLQQLQRSTKKIKTIFTLPLFFTSSHSKQTDQRTKQTNEHLLLSSIKQNQKIINKKNI